MSGDPARAALARLNALAPEAAESELAAVCGARAWARAVTARRPFAGPAELRAAAEDAWDALDEDDWREAIAAHPRLGESRRPDGAPAGGWARAEQAAVAVAPDAEREALVALQRRYEERFGHGFLFCASGRTAEEARAACAARLANDPATEIAVAAEEERRIGRLRIGNLLAEGGAP